MTIAVALVLGLVVGLPIALLAAAVTYHASVAARSLSGATAIPFDFGAGLEAELDELEAFEQSAPPPQVQSYLPYPSVAQLQQTVDELQAQLARQRAALSDLLSDRATPAPRAEARTIASPAPAPPIVPIEDDLRTVVHRLAAEGQSERAIARRLRIGLEEVRLLGRQQPQERAS